MNDDLGLFAEPATDSGEANLHEADWDDRPARQGRSGRGAGRARGPARRRRKVTLAVFAVLMLVIVGGGGWYGLQQVLALVNYKDYSGSGESEVVVQVGSGSLAAMGNRLVDAGVVASARAFTSAAGNDDRASKVQPGFYVMKTKMSGTAAVAKIVDPASRVGQLEIKGGNQLDDVIAPDGKPTLGIISLLAKASCTQLNGQNTCVPVDALRTVFETADLAALGVPDWAIPDASKAEPRRRLEGLITPGEYDVKPGSDAQTLLKTVVQASSSRLQAIGMPSIAANTGFSPYQVFIVASLVEREAITKDFGKVARVTYNRLALPMELKYDSTVNYPLDRPIITTTTQDRERPGPYNTYVNYGLPPTPISAPSTEAILAAVKPDTGNWLYFVKCEKDGTSCFGTTPAEHDANRAKARANGAY